jgi:GNAT superfamily N-acetyltransferase
VNDDCVVEVLPLAPEHVADCLAVAASLPEWFGYPNALEGIERSLRTERGFVAAEAGAVAAFVSFAERFEESVEITYLAVHRESRRLGLGRQLVVCARDAAAELGASSLCLLTLGPSSQSAPYAETVAFYLAVGFWRTKECRLADWGGAPALLMSAPLERLG